MLKKVRVIYELLFCILTQNYLYMNKLQIIIVLLFLVCNTGYAQSDSYFKNGINDDVVFRGINVDNYYYFLMSSGTYSYDVDIRELEIKGYDNFLLKFDDSLNIVDSVYFGDIGDYNISNSFLTAINDTLILMGRALKPDLSDEQIIVSKYLLPSLSFVDQQLYGDTTVLERINDFLINHRGNLVISAVNMTDLVMSPIFMEISKNGDLLKYSNDSSLDILWSTVYQMPSTLDYIFNSTLKTIVFDSTLTNYFIFWNPNSFNFQYWGRKCYHTDSTYIIAGNKLTQPPLISSWDNSYFIVNDQHEYIDSGFIYLPDTNDFIGGIDFISPSTVIYGGTHNKNWSQQTPEIFEEEYRWIVLKSEDIITKNENWFFTYGGDANYVMRNILVTENNTCIVFCTRYDWEETEIWQRDILIFEVDSNGIIVSNNNEHYEIPIVTIYPNPTNNSITIKNNFINGRIIIRDLTGKTLVEKEITSGIEYIDISLFKSGFYLISFYEGQQFLFSRKLIKN